MTVSRWCADPTLHQFEIHSKPDGGGEWTSETVQVTGHQLCVHERWHDESHTSCCARADELESWACTCGCHEGGSGRRMT